MYTNPFRPTAGAEPPRLIGRDQAIMDFVSGLEGGVGAPGRLMRITGPRGSGKTVLLTDLGARAQRMGWEIANVTAGPSLIEDLVYELSPNMAIDSYSASVSAAVVSGDATVQVKHPNLRALMKKSAERSKGLVITIDEVQDAAVEDMQRIASAVQHLIREKVDIALIFAGLPSGVMDLINGEALTFLRRALSEALQKINLVEVEISFRDSFEATGLKIENEELSRLAAATEGYAYLIQLVGYYVWQRADLHRAESNIVTSTDVAEGVAIAMGQFHEAVHEPAIAGLSEGAMNYLLAMAQDTGRSSSSTIAERMGKEAKATSSYRRSLIQKEVIQSPARGYVEFAVPFLREYLLDHAQELRERY